MTSGTDSSTFKLVETSNDNAKKQTVVSTAAIISIDVSNEKPKLKSAAEGDQADADKLNILSKITGKKVLGLKDGFNKFKVHDTRR